MTSVKGRLSLTDSPDEQLVEAALGGSVDGFIGLCQRHYPALVALAQSVLGDRHLAEDAAQEALAKACRSLPSLAKPASFASWVGTICRNQAVDLLRRTSPLESLGDRDVAAQEAPTKPEADAVRDALSLLSREAREIVHLHYYAGLSYEQMSQVLGLTPQAINGRLRRARQSIREHLTRNADLGGPR